MHKFGKKYITKLPKYVQNIIIQEYLQNKKYIYNTTERKG